MITFVINLKNSTDRWSKYENTDYHRWEATERTEVDDETIYKMISMHNYPLYKHLGRCACFLSHMKLLEHIIKNKINDVLILEDDAVKFNDLPKHYSNDGITYVGGWAHSKKMGNAKNVIINDNQNEGISKKEDFRILMTMSYIVPTWHIAKKIVDFIKSKKRYRAIDIMYDDLPMPIYYCYPASFIEDICPSTIDTSKKKRADQYYQLH